MRFNLHSGMNQMTKYRHKRKNVKMPKNTNGFSNMASQIFMAQDSKPKTKEYQ